MFSFLVSLTLVMGAIVVYSVLISPELDNIQRMRGTLESQSRSQAEQQRLVETAKKLLADYEKGGEALKGVVNLTLPNDANVSQAVSNIETLVLLNNLSLTTAQTELPPFQATVSAPGSIKNRGTVKITVTLRGAYEDFKKFISQVENNVRIMDVKQLGVKQSSGSFRPDGTLEFSLVTNAYYQDPSAMLKTNTK